MTCQFLDGHSRPFGFAQGKLQREPSDYYESDIKVSGGDSGEATPDPIPNSEVKLSRADDTAFAGRWESRSPPGLIQKPPQKCGGFFIFRAIIISGKVLN